MAERNPPSWLQGGAHPADLDRMLTGALVATPGIVAAGDLAVTQTATPSMGVSVAGGRAFVAGTRAPSQGVYHVVSDGPRTVTLAASDAVNGRRDLIVARVRDAAYDAGLADDWTLEAVTGTPAGTPVDPAVPPDALVLARVVVGANVTSVTNANVTDLRPASRLRASLLEPSGLRELLTYTSGGTFVKANYPWLRAVRVRLVGGGGGGGGAATTGAGAGSCGSGGGGAGYAERLILVADLPASVAVTVGAAGAAGVTGSNGGNGTASSFGSLVAADGGNGGNGGSATTGNGSTFGGQSGSGTTGTVLLDGDAGDSAYLASGHPTIPNGGASALGGGGRGGANGNGSAGGRGGGGGGCRNVASQATARSGGAGGAGLVVVELYG